MTHDPVCLKSIDSQRAKTVLEYAGQSYYFCSVACKNLFEKDPDHYLKPYSGLRITVGVMGSAEKSQPELVSDIAFRLGKAIAKRNFVLITGACPGLPYDCAKGAKQFDGLSIGISPALSFHEHVNKYHSPTDSFDVIIYTGSGLMGREVTNIRSSDMVIILGGRSGTLGEFAIAYDEGKLIGIMKGTGGIAERIPEIIESFGDKETGAKLIYESDPETLILKLAQAYTTKHYKRPSCFCDEPTPAG